MYIKENIILELKALNSAIYLLEQLAKDKSLNKMLAKFQSILIEHISFL